MKMVLEVAGNHDKVPPQPSHDPTLTFTGFKTLLHPCIAGAFSGRACWGSNHCLWCLWFGAQDPDVRGTRSEAQACICLQHLSLRVPHTGNSVASLIQMKTRQDFPACFSPSVQWGARQGKECVEAANWIVK